MAVGLDCQMPMQPVSYAWVLLILMLMIPYSQAQQDCLGTCVTINKCPALFDTLRLSRTGNSDAIQKLRSLVCSSANGGLKVCCNVGGENAPPKGTDHISFEEYIAKYDITFGNKTEEKRGKQIFLDNLNKIDEHNKRYDEGLTSYSKGVNQFTHLTYEEFISKHTGLDISGVEFDHSHLQTYIPINPAKKHPSIDWIGKRVLNPIKDQKGCNSCWAFAAASVIESQIAIRHGVLQNLSEQYLIDCDKTNSGCWQGWPAKAIHYVIKNGIAKSSNYNYNAKNGTCDEAKPKTNYTVAFQNKIEYESDNDLMNANFHIGPISVSIYFPPSAQLYSNGFFDEDNECTASHPPNHSLLLVGYGEYANGTTYWHLRDSHGTGFGEQGYWRLSRKSNNYCQISSHATFPILTVPDCPSPWVLVFNECFLVVNISKNWLSASSYCQANATDAISNLAQPNNINVMVKHLLRTPATSDLGWMWLGGKKDDSGVWRWINGTAITTTQWDQGFPDDEADCLSMLGSSEGKATAYLMDYFCVTGYTPFICQRY